MSDERLDLCPFYHLLREKDMRWEAYKGNELIAEADSYDELLGRVEAAIERGQTFEVTEKNNENNPDLDNDLLDR